MRSVLRLGKLVPASRTADDPLRYAGPRRCVLLPHGVSNLSSLSKSYKHTRKRCVFFCVTKLQPTTQKLNLATQAVVVKPCRIRPRWKKHYNFRPRLPGFFVGFLYPVPNLSAVRRITEHRFAPPILGKSVVLLRVELATLRILCCGARVKREVMLCIEVIEKLLRRIPDACFCFVYVSHSLQPFIVGSG